MNTLNYKVLLAKMIFMLFIRALGIYLLMTISALAAQPVLYEMSALYAVSFGWLAGIVFLFFMYAVQKIQTATLKKIFTYTAVPIAVTAAFQLMEITGAQHRIWQSGAFLLFPACAVVSGWISVAISWRRLDKLCAGNNNSNAAAGIYHPVSTPENSIQ